MANREANDKQGCHQFIATTGLRGPVIFDGGKLVGEPYGAFEVRWAFLSEKEGWYWWALVPDGYGAAAGPFATSQEAYNDAQEEV